MILTVAFGKFGGGAITRVFGFGLFAMLGLALVDTAGLTLEVVALGLTLEVVGF